MINQERVESDNRCKWNNNDDVLQQMVFDAEEKKRLAAYAAGANDRMWERFHNAMKFMQQGGGQDAQTYECQSLC